jgi:hypothetical protein
VAEEVADLEPLGQLARHRVAARHLLGRRGKVVIENHEYALGIEDLVDAQLQELERADREGLVRHHAVGPGGDVLTRGDRVPPCRTGQHLLGHRHAHAAASGRILLEPATARRAPCAWGLAPLLQVGRM